MQNVRKRVQNSIGHRTYLNWILADTNNLSLTLSDWKLTTKYSKCFIAFSFGIRACLRLHFTWRITAPIHQRKPSSFKIWHVSGWSDLAFSICIHLSNVCNTLNERILETLLRYELKKHSLIPRDSSTVLAVINMMIHLTLPEKNIRVFEWPWYSAGKGLGLNYIRDSSGIFSISSLVKISMILLISSLPLKLYLNSLVYDRDIFGSSSKVIGSLRKSLDLSSEIFGQC